LIKSVDQALAATLSTVEVCAVAPPECCGAWARACPARLAGGPEGTARKAALQLFQRWWCGGAAAAAAPEDGDDDHGPAAEAAVAGGRGDPLSTARGTGVGNQVFKNLKAPSSELKDESLQDRSSL